MKKIGITNLNVNKWGVFFKEEFCPKLGLRKEYKDKKIEKSPNIKYKYCSERNFTIDVHKITPGVQKHKICHKTSILFLRELKFLIEPPIPRATLAIL